VPWTGCRIERSRFFSVRKSYELIFAFSLGLLVLSIGVLTHANLYRAPFPLASPSPPCPTWERSSINLAGSSQSC
jgi:hypothetical protein